MMRRLLLAALLLALAAGAADARRRHHGYYGFERGVEQDGERGDRYGRDDPAAGFGERSGSERRGDRYRRDYGRNDSVFGERGDRYDRRRRERYGRDDATTGFGGVDTYRRARRGVEAVVPANWQLQPPDPRWSGKRFVSPAGDAWFALYTAAADKDPRDEHVKKVAFTEGEELTYLRREPDWLVVSGFKDAKRDRIFYRKAMLACDGRIWRHVALEYPADQKRAFDPLVVRAGRALDDGDGADCLAPAAVPAAAPAAPEQPPAGAPAQPPAPAPSP